MLDALIPASQVRRGHDADCRYVPGRSNAPSTCPPGVAMNSVCMRCLTPDPAFVQALQEAAAAGQPAPQAAAAAAAAAEAGAEATKGMAAAAGRSSYVPVEALAGNADPGAKAVAAWLRAAAQAL